MDIKKRYKNIVKVPKEFLLTTIKPFVPTPSSEDYDVGYIRRNFLQKANDVNAIIYEIDDRTYSNLGDNPLFVTVTLNWKISGTEEEIKKVNKKVIIYASRKIPALTLYLPNLLQFSKNNLGE